MENPLLSEHQALRDAQILVASREHRVPVDRITLEAAQRQQLLTALGVSCFVENRDSILMWLHYSASHRGFCLGFQTADDPFRRAMVVEYMTSYPHVHITAPSEEQMRAMIFTKFEDWGYEHEWRVILPDVDLVSYPEEALSEVILGANMSEADRTALLSLLARRGHMPSVFQAMRADDEYRLFIEPLS